MIPNTGCRVPPACVRLCDPWTEARATPLREPSLGQEPRGSEAESSQSPLGCSLGPVTAAQRFHPVALGPLQRPLCPTKAAWSQAFLHHQGPPHPHPRRPPAGTSFQRGTAATRCPHGSWHLTPSGHLAPQPFSYYHTNQARGLRRPPLPHAGRLPWEAPAPDSSAIRSQ